jgi:hypothetical protein
LASHVKCSVAFPFAPSTSVAGPTITPSVSKSTSYLFVAS